MNIMITGATGFIASGLALKLAGDGNKIHALVRDISKASELNHPNIRLFKGDLNDQGSIRAAMEHCDQVYHCAAYARLWAKDRNDFYRTNLEGTRNVLAQAYKTGINKLVFTSSTAVFGTSKLGPMNEHDPRITAYDTDYELSKHLAEEEVKNYTNHGLQCVIVNPSRVFGPGPLSYSNAIARLLLQALQKKTVVIPMATNTLANYAYVADVVNGHIKAMEQGKAGERYILGGENLSYKDVISAVKKKINTVRIISLPLLIMKAAGWIQLLKYNLTGSLPEYTPKMLDRYFLNAAFSCQKAEKELGYKITPFNDAIEETIQYLKINYL